jgi:hypothetical protein
MPQLNASDLSNNTTPIAWFLSGQGTTALANTFPSGATVTSVFPKMAVQLQ